MMEFRCFEDKTGNIYVSKTNIYANKTTEVFMPTLEMDAHTFFATLANGGIKNVQSRMWKEGSLDLTLIAAWKDGKLFLCWRPETRNGRNFLGIEGMDINCGDEIP
jgi:hypothetical protein